MELYVVVGAALASREDGLVHPLLKVLSVLQVLAEEDQTGTWPTKRLMRRSSDYIAVLERIVQDLGGDQP